MHRNSRKRYQELPLHDTTRRLCDTYPKSKVPTCPVQRWEQKEERYHNAIDEYYGFVTEYPESKYMKEANELFAKAKKYVQSDSNDTANLSK